MLNKKKVVTVIIIIFLIITAVFVVCKGSSKVVKTYNKLLNSNEYLFEMDNNNGYDIVIAKKGNNTCIDMNNDGERVTTLIKDNSAYVISHSQREYQVYSKEAVGEIAVTDLLGDLDGKKYTKGKEKVNDKNYKYEEYSEFASFLLAENADLESNQTKTRFYFDKDDLVYIKTIPENGEQELLEVKIEYSAPDELFEIPSDYAKKDDSGF